MPGTFGAPASTFGSGTFGTLAVGMAGGPVRPVVSATTERIYARLPEYLRAADALEPSGGGFPLLRLLSLVGDQLGEIETLLDRIAYVPPESGGEPDDTSDLVDPNSADDAWLPWLAQLLGIETGPVGGLATTLPYGTMALQYPHYSDLPVAFSTYGEMAAKLTPPAGTRSAAELRAAIANVATQSWLAGSVQSIVEAVQSILTGSRIVTVIPNNGGAFEVGIVTYAYQTPDPFAPSTAVARAGVKPGGVNLTFYSLTNAPYAALPTGFAHYSDLDAAFATYADLAAYVPPS